MIRPIIHRQLTRGDLACLVDEIARMDVNEGREADQALQAGAVDAVLDSPAALEAVLGRGGAPAPLPLTLLWYIPIRAQLRFRGVTDILLADYAATLPVAFATAHSHSAIARTGPAWRRGGSSSPHCRRAPSRRRKPRRTRRAWRGVAGASNGSSAVEAAARCARASPSRAACSRSPPICSRRRPEEAALCTRAAEARNEGRAALIEARSDPSGMIPSSKTASTVS